jgi:hypothetical protein
VLVILAGVLALGACKHAVPGSAVKGYDAATDSVPPGKRLTPERMNQLGIDAGKSYDLALKHGDHGNDEGAMGDFVQARYDA